MEGLPDLTKQVAILEQAFKDVEPQLLLAETYSHRLIEHKQQQEMTVDSIGKRVEEIRRQLMK